MKGDVTMKRYVKHLKRAAILLAGIAVAVIYLAPVFWIFSTSLRLPKDSFRWPPAFLPTSFHIKNYATLFNSVPYENFLLNSLYIALIVVLCMIQDVIMSQVTIFGATTDLAVAAILLITVIEGVDVGSIFVLIASCLFYFSGSSPGPLCVGLMTFLGIGACLFRQMYWHRNQASIVLCAGLALMLYELGNFIVGIASELTRWDRLGIFVTTGLLSVAVMLPLYALINRIGQIGGNTWKE